MIKSDIIEAKKVIFLEAIHEDDFTERGMKAYLTKIEFDEVAGDETVFKLYFDFTEFEEENDKYLINAYYPNIHTNKLNSDKSLFDAKEAGIYTNKYMAYHSERNFDGTLRELEKYIREID